MLQRTRFTIVVPATRDEWIEQLDEFEVGHRANGIDQRRAKGSDRFNEPLHFLKRSTVAEDECRSQKSIRHGCQTGTDGQFVRGGAGELAVKVQDLSHPV